MCRLEFAFYQHWRSSLKKVSYTDLDVVRKVLIHFQAISCLRQPNTGAVLYLF